MDSELAELAPAQLAGRQMVRTMVSETTSNSRFRRSRTSIQETGASRLKTTSSTLSPSTRKSDRGLVPLRFFLTEVAESEFRTQPVATAVSETGCVDTTPTCTRADAHNFSRAHITVHNSQHFSKCGHTALPQGERNLCCAFLRTHFHLVVMFLSDGLLGRFPPVTSSPTCSLSRPSASSTSLGRGRVNLCAFAHWSGMSGCLVSPTPHAALQRFNRRKGAFLFCVILPLQLTCRPTVRSFLSNFWT